MEFSSGFLTEQMAKASILSTKKKGQLSATLPSKMPHSLLAQSKKFLSLSLNHPSTISDLFLFFAHSITKPSSSSFFWAVQKKKKPHNFDSSLSFYIPWNCCVQAFVQQSWSSYLWSLGSLGAGATSDGCQQVGWCLHGEEASRK